MDEKKRKANETEFDSWTDNDKRGRIYYFEINGKLGWKAKYLKEVDKDEITIRFWQEIYDENSILREIHEKYPVDKGHKKKKMITKKIIVEKLLAYLQHRSSLADVVAWAEQALLNADYKDDSSHTIRNILAQLGTADVTAFGLEWKDCESIMERLGFKLEVKALEVA